MAVKYHVTVQRSGKYWAVHVKEIDRWTQARHLREVEPMARDLVAVMEDVEPDSFTLVVEREIPESVRRHLARAEALRAEAAAKQNEAARESRAAVKDLVSSGVSQREAGELLGMSFQRVNQLVKS